MTDKSYVRTTEYKTDVNAAPKPAPIADMSVTTDKAGFDYVKAVRLNGRATFVYLTGTDDCRIVDPQCTLGSYWFAPAASAVVHYERLREEVTVEQLVAAGWTYRQMGIAGLFCDKAGQEPDNPAALGPSVDFVPSGSTSVGEWLNYAQEVLVGKWDCRFDDKGEQWVECFLFSCRDVMLKRYQGRDQDGKPSMKHGRNDPELSRCWRILGELLKGPHAHTAAGCVKDLVAAGLGDTGAALEPIRLSRELAEREVTAQKR